MLVLNGKRIDYKYIQNVSDSSFASHTHSHPHFYKILFATPTKKNSNSFELSSFPMRACTLTNLIYSQGIWPLFCVFLCVCVGIFWGSLNLVDDAATIKQPTVYSVELSSAFLSRIFLLFFCVKHQHILRISMYVLAFPFSFLSPSFQFNFTNSFFHCD